MYICLLSFVAFLVEVNAQSSPALSCWMCGCPQQVFFCPQQVTFFVHSRYFLSTAGNVFTTSRRLLKTEPLLKRGMMHPIQEGSEEAILAEQCSGNCTGDQKIFCDERFLGDKRFFVIERSTFQTCFPLQVLMIWEVS